MSSETVTPPKLKSVSSRRVAFRVGLGAVVVALLSAAWYFGIERPQERAAAKQAADLVKERATKAMKIADLNLDLVWIAPGDFMMGTAGPNFLVRWLNEAHDKFPWIPGHEVKGFENERPQTYVVITKGYWLGRTDVTQAQYEAVMGSNPSSFKGRDLPVETVSWDDATEFCKKLTERERTAGRLQPGYRYTLPREAQWEYACRAGTTGDYAGDLDAMAWYDANSGGTTHLVGAKQPNAWGLYDMHGNVWEWCADWHAPYPGGMLTDPVGPASGSDRVFRGGGWNGVAAGCRSARRGCFVPGFRVGILGFRLALSSVR